MKFTDQQYLRSEQYKNAENLNARIQVHQSFSTNKQGLYLWIFDHLKLPENSRILELGCGSGTIWVENMSKIADGWKIILSDLSPGMLEKAEENLREINEQVEYKTIDAQSIPYEDGYFDAVMANFMLFHVPNRNQAMAEIHRVLKPGGSLFAATNGRKHMRELREMIKEIDKDAEITSAGELFGLENGGGQLAQYFSEVELYRYEDSLVITEVEPLVDYVLSSKRSVLIEENPQRIADIIKREIETKGAFRITKDAGMFVATRSV